MVETSEVRIKGRTKKQPRDPNSAARRVTITVPAELRSKINLLAGKSDLSMSAICLHALRKYVEELESGAEQNDFETIKLAHNNA